MRVLVVGVGAVGGWLAAVLARGGADVALLARGQALEALLSSGLTLIDGERRETYRLAAANRIEELPRPDAVFLAVKTYGFADAVNWARGALAHGLLVVTAMNGLPWWFLSSLDGPLRDRRLESVDPGGRAAAMLTEVRPVAGVVHASMRAEAPGVIRVPAVDRLILGEPSSLAAAETLALAKMIEAGGVPCPVSSNIRVEIWAKLWGNMNMNPLSALTRLSGGKILGDPHLLGLVRAMMSEFVRVGERIGIRLPMTVDERLVVTQRLGDFRTSMVNDLEAGRPLEVEGLLGVVVEMAEMLDEPVPASRAVYALARAINPRR
jgi:2-dehydropantoate 2-reductase